MSYESIVNTEIVNASSTFDRSKNWVPCRLSQSTLRPGSGALTMYIHTYVHCHTNKMSPLRSYIGVKGYWHHHLLVTFLDINELSNAKRWEMSTLHMRLALPSLFHLILQCWCGSFRDLHCSGHHSGPDECWADSGHQRHSEEDERKENANDPNTGMYVGTFTADNYSVSLCMYVYLSIRNVPICIQTVHVYCWVGVTRQDSIMVLGDEAVIKKSHLTRVLLRLIFRVHHLRRPLVLFHWARIYQSHLFFLPQRADRSQFG